MATFSRRIGGSDEFPIYRVAESGADGAWVFTFELHGPQGVLRTFSTWSQAQEFLDAMQGKRVLS